MSQGSRGGELNQLWMLPARCPFAVFPLLELSWDWCHELSLLVKFLEESMSCEPALQVLTESFHGEGEEPPESLFMKELKRRGVNPSSLLEDAEGASSRSGLEDVAAEEEKDGGERGRSKRNGVASAEYEKSASRQRELSMALNSEGIEVLEMGKNQKFCSFAAGFETDRIPEEVTVHLPPLLCPRRIPGEVTMFQMLAVVARYQNPSDAGGGALGMLFLPSGMLFLP
ncbi:hypothetical protein KSP39_PZI019874 [Platanthera zijinensis]|uniref:Uncharacterized protein n=1 Tax=Platanthera zijinensis TaxID=2320716 RepID=A0AAP0B1D6_9ASPA